MDFAHELITETEAFGALIAAGDPAAAVPSCPGWNLTQLFRHVGRGNRWAAQIVLDRATEGVDPRTVPEGKPPDNPDDAIDWLRAGARKLTGAVAEEPDAEVWTFTGPQPASWWERRRVHETVVHRADAAIATGAPFDVDPVLAADTVSEWLELATARGGTPSGTVHLHATDSGLNTTGEWTIADGRWSREHAKGDVALRGAVADVLLALTGRMPVESLPVEVFGDAALWQTWLDATRL